MSVPQLLKKLPEIYETRKFITVFTTAPSVDMLPFGVTIPAAVPQGSKIPEGLMNNPAY
jgi:hypothetical protein